MRRDGRIVAVAVLLAAAALVAWLLLRGDDHANPAAPSSTTSPATADDGASPANSARKPAADARAAAAASVADADAPIPPPVDLDAVDRDRDLHGVVVRKDGTPVAGAQVVAVLHPWRRAGGLSLDAWKDAAAGPGTRSASDGTFALRLRRGTRAELRVVADGFSATRTKEHLAGERVRIVLEAGVRLRVAVVDETNRVVPGVTLSIRDDEKTTDADGVAVFDGLPPSSRLSVDLVSSGWGDIGIREFATGERPVSEEKLVLTKGRTLRGRVVDAESAAPIAKAHVGMNWTGEHAVETDADGRYVLPGWMGVNVREISCRARGFAREEERVGAREEIDFRLKRGFELAGRVVGAAGRPVAGARVEVIASTMISGEQRTSFGDATTDADGRFRVDSLDPAMGHVVVATADGLGKSRTPLAAPGFAKEVDIGDVVLATGRVLAGRFVDADGKPQPGRGIVLDGPKADFGAGFEGNDYGAQEDLRTDDLGRFAFADLVPGEYVVRTEYDGSVQCETTATLPPDRDVLDVVLRMAPSTAIEVRVVDDDGAPIADADVMAICDSPDPPTIAPTDAKGVAHLQIPWDAATLQVDPPYGVTRRFVGCDSVQWKKGDAVKPFVLREGAAVQGVLVDAQGKPVPAAKLRVEQDGEEPRWRETDDSGRFDLVFPKGAKVRLVYDGTSQGKETGLLGAVDCSAPQAGVAIHAAPIETDRVLVIKATTPTGEPVAGAIVDVRGYGWNEPRTATTGADGIARLEALPARALSVSCRATADLACSASSSVTPAGQTIVVALRRGVVLRGVVSGPDGSPATAGITVWRGDEEVGTVLAGADGKFELRVPDVEGGLSWSAHGDDGRASGDIEAPPAEGLKITLAK